METRGLSQPAAGPFLGSSIPRAKVLAEGATESQCHLGRVRAGGQEMWILGWT